MNNQTMATPTKPSPVEKKIDAGIRRAHRIYGPNLNSFFDAVVAEVLKRHKAETVTQDTRFLKSRETRP